MPRISRFYVRITAPGEPKDDLSSFLSPFFVARTGRLESKVPRMVLKDAQDTILLRKVARNDSFETGDSPEPPILIVLFSEGAYLHEQINRSNKVAFLKDFMNRPRDLGVVLVLFIR